MPPQVQIQTVRKQHRIILSTAAGLLVLSGFIYALCFFVPRSVTLNYASDTCVSGLTLLPSLHGTVDESHYKVSYKQPVRIGELEVAALKTCVSPSTAPKEGSAIVATAPLGGLFARTHLSVNVEKPPVANVGNLATSPVPATKPLLVPLSESDKIFSYQLEVDDTLADCEPVKKAINCQIDNLKLSQGKKYDFELMRSFKGSDKTSLGAGALETLRAVTVKKTSVNEKQTVYSKPKSFTVSVDKSLKAATTRLVKIDGSTTTDIESTTLINNKTITVTTPNDLERETSYRLVIDSVEAVDGSTLIEPFKRNFKISGGPKVTGLNIGANRVGQSATIIVSFDQALSTKQPIANYIGVSGGSVSVSRYSSSQVAIRLNNVARCQPIAISVKAGLMSKYNIVGKSTYQHNSRTICHTVSTIGTSRQGRAINSYTFGSGGPVTLFVGALHGNEPSSSLILQDWTNELEANPSRIKGKRIVVVPTVNPDGLAAGTRNNSKDVNLNRNFPTDNWVKDIDDTDGPNEGGGGSSPLSEPEARALANLSTALSPRLMISYHAIGSVVIGDPGGYSAAYAAKYASLTGYRNATGQSASTFDYSITGSYEDWTIQKQGIPSMVIELGSYTYRNFSHHRSAFWAML